MIKRVVFCILVFGLVFSSFNFNTVAAKTKKNDPNNDVTIIDNIKYTVIVDENGENMLQLKNLLTGEVEFIKTVIEDNAHTNYVLSSEGEVIHKVQYFEEEDKLYIDEELMGDGGQSLASIEDSGPEYAAYDPGGAGSSWKYLSTTYGSNAEKLTHQSIMVGFVSAALMLPAWYQLVTNTVNALWSAEVTQIWYKRYNYVDAYANYTTCRRANKTYFYRYSNYTGYLYNTNLIVQPIDPCNSGY
ncbi:hypothetical protein [Bacillus suaedaesalsae]|uniref:Uncharacterized protein n=1 Tax=Bacillus suaedaesalsae TaxID=2810349 RepID=A0ABS2DCL0_9BACI|nr:hypothetical protein [Bacillus suaedaesalsae]MBM6616187.1 hypothetical protein [Bacillus suaedaesalsae]